MKIKNILLTAAVALGLTGFATQAKAQQDFKKGTQVASLLLGLNSNFSSLSSTLVPPLQASYEYGVADKLAGGKGSIGVGGTLDYLATKGTGYNLVKTVSHAILLGARGSFHYQFMPKLDTYAGVTLGVNIGHASVSTPVAEANKLVNESSSATNVGFGWAIHAGTRYFFTPSFAVNAEVGYGFTILAIGASYRF